MTLDNFNNNCGKITAKPGYCRLRTVCPIFIMRYGTVFSNNYNGHENTPNAPMHPTDAYYCQTDVAVYNQYGMYCGGGEIEFQLNFFALCDRYWVGVSHCTYVTNFSLPSFSMWGHIRPPCTIQPHITTMLLQARIHPRARGKYRQTDRPN